MTDRVLFDPPPELGRREGAHPFDLINAALAFYGPSKELKGALIWFAVAAGILAIGEPRHD